MAVQEDLENANQVSERVRKKWTEYLNSGQADLRTLIEYSKKSDEDKYIASIRLINILAARPDWSRATALEVLQRFGFNDKSSIKSIRVSPAKIEAFESILITAADRWRARAEPPKGWPWSGKLSLLIEIAGDSVPDELAALMDDDDDEDAYVDNASEESVDEDILSLLDDDEDEDE